MTLQPGHCEEPLLGDEAISTMAQREAMAEPVGDGRSDWGAIEQRIEGAVKSGKMTRDEADAKYREIRERMARRRER